MISESSSEKVNRPQNPILILYHAIDKAEKISPNNPDRLAANQARFNRIESDLVSGDRQKRRKARRDTALEAVNSVPGLRKIVSASKEKDEVIPSQEIPYLSKRKWIQEVVAWTGRSEPEEIIKVIEGKSADYKGFSARFRATLLILQENGYIIENSPEAKLFTAAFKKFKNENSDNITKETKAILATKKAIEREILAKKGLNVAAGFGTALLGNYVASPFIELAHASETMLAKLPKKKEAGQTKKPKPTTPPPAVAVPAYNPSSSLKQPLPAATPILQPLVAPYTSEPTPTYTPSDTAEKNTTASLLEISSKNIVNRHGQKSIASLPPFKDEETPLPDSTSP